MIKQILRFRILIVVCLVLALFCSDALAWGGGGRHYYNGGRWYRHGWLGFDIAVSALTIGALIESMPPRYSTVVVGGVPYYYYDGVYCRPYPRGGYVVVPQPVMAMPEAAPVVVTAPPPAIQPQTQISDSVTVNIPNLRGGYTAVTLKRSGNGFVGPQGEYYTEFPNVEQLKVMYGK